MHAFEDRNFAGGGRGGDGDVRKRGANDALLPQAEAAYIPMFPKPGSSVRARLAHSALQASMQQPWS